MALLLALVLVVMVGIYTYVQRALTFDIEYVPTDEDSKNTIKYLKNKKVISKSVEKRLKIQRGK